MRLVPFAVLLALLSPLLRAQDKITLTNGDVLNGTIKTMADGKLILTNAAIGDITIPFASIANLSTTNPVELVTSDGEILKRRITGIDHGELRLDGGAPGAPAAPALAVAMLGKINPPPVEVKWTGSLKVSGALTTGNTERRSIGAAFDAVRRSDADRISADAAWDFAEDKDPATNAWRLTQRRVGAGLKYDYFISKRWYALATTRVLGDTFADLQLRYTAGVGVGYQWIESDTTNFLTEVGLSYFNENYLSATPSKDYLAARVAYKLRHAFSDRTRVIHGTEAFPSLENAKDVYFQMSSELQTNLTDSMIASLAHVWDWDNTPAPGRERSDHRIVLSVGWTF
ncbi:MAG TPA: DUF481 domain-containing protein [Planctomycetota bacterium]|nr:DUF481 domain-containing protein [Planctomycetota bacterium]